MRPENEDHEIRVLDGLIIEIRRTNESVFVQHFTEHDNGGIHSHVFGYQLRPLTAARARPWYRMSALQWIVVVASIVLCAEGALWLASRL